MQLLRQLIKPLRKLRSKKYLKHWPQQMLSGYGLARSCIVTISLMTLGITLENETPSNNDSEC
jgi:hypothetical protein